MCQIKTLTVLQPLRQIETLTRTPQASSSYKKADWKQLPSCVDEIAKEPTGFHILTLMMLKKELLKYLISVADTELLFDYFWRSQMAQILLNKRFYFSYILTCYQKHQTLPYIEKKICKNSCAHQRDPSVVGFLSFCEGNLRDTSSPL